MQIGVKRVSLRKTANRMKARYDKRRKVATDYKIGDLVMTGLRSLLSRALILDERKERSPARDP